MPNSSLNSSGAIPADNVAPPEHEQAGARDYSSAISDVLEVIVRSPGDSQPVFDAIVRWASRLCGGEYAIVNRFDGEFLHLVAQYNARPGTSEETARSWPRRATREQSIDARAILDGIVVNIPDLDNAGLEPEWRDFHRRIGARSAVCAPMICQGRPIGVISVSRSSSGPFPDPQVDVLRTFANQAVIAIENARLFEAEQTRTRELQESLEYQTAISGALEVISRSPTDLQPVIDTLIEAASRLCDAPEAAFFQKQGDVYVPRGTRGLVPDFAQFLREHPISPGPGTLVGRVALEKRLIHMHDTATDADYTRRETVEIGGQRSQLGVPLMRHNVPIGVIALARRKVEPFTARQIALVTTFANQAVIAINNVGLFEEVQARTKELQESLEYQSATGDVLSVISRSPNEVQAVLDTIVKTVTSLCGADASLIWRLKPNSGDMEVVAHCNLTSERQAFLASNPIGQSNPNVPYRAMEQKRTLHIHDVRADPEFSNLLINRTGRQRTQLCVPLLDHGKAIGVISMVRRDEVRPFTSRQIALVETFADQAVIAIENARLLDELKTRQNELEARTRELTESLEYQTATSDVLSVISRSPNELQPVLDAIVATAERLCDGDRAQIFVEREGRFELAAHRNTEPDIVAHFLANPITPGRGTATARAALEGRTVHVPDVKADPEYGSDDFHTMLGGARLVVPLKRSGRTIGLIAIPRRAANPFAARQIALVETFADQAVIAINNVGLFEEVQARTKELQESLEYQTATSEVLSVISRSPNELQPVLLSIADTASRLCGTDDVGILLREGDHLRFTVNRGSLRPLSERLPVARDWVSGRTVVDCVPVHVHDLQAEADEYPLGHEIAERYGHRTALGVPLVRDGRAIGCIFLRRTEVRPFSGRQIAQLQTFADQAVIAINNVGLFEEVQARTKELTESLEYQTATSEVLSVISRSPNELMPVLQTIAEMAGRMCDTNSAAIWLPEGNAFRLRITYGLSDEYRAIEEAVRLEPDRGSIVGRVALTRQTEHIHDCLDDPDYAFKEDARVGGLRTMLGVPLMRAGEVVGIITLWRYEVAPFSEKQVQIVSVFASQAVIAINNTRLFEEVQARTRELARSVEELKSLGAVGQAVSSTLDMGTVLQTVLENAARMAFASGGTIYVYDPERRQFHLEAGYNMSDEHTARVRAQPIRMGEPVVGVCAERREAVQIEDLQLAEVQSPLLQILLRAGVRAILAVPLLHQGDVIGALVVRRSYPGAFSVETVRLLEAFAAQSAIAVNNARLFKEVEEKGEQLRLASQHKSHFLANMSHELRTPLNAILGYTELMVDGAFGQLANEQRETLDRVERNGRHLLGLINDVLDLSKIEAGEMALAIDEYSVGSLIRTAIVATEPLARQKGLSLDARIADQLPLGRGDTRRLAQVLLNLIGNAIKFTDQGGVMVTANCERSSFRIEVRDTGPGIAGGDIERIFEKFQQVDNTSTRKKGGTGLGLAISREFVQMHGGTIDVSSVLGEGTVFAVTLPVEADVHRETLHRPQSTLSMPQRRVAMEPGP